jgi:hypothetical protein
MSGFHTLQNGEIEGLVGHPNGSDPQPLYCQPEYRRVQQGAGSVVVSRDLAMVTTWVQIPASAHFCEHSREQKYRYAGFEQGVK